MAAKLCVTGAEPQHIPLYLRGIFSSTVQLGALYLAAQTCEVPAPLSHIGSSTRVSHPDPAPRCLDTPTPQRWMYTRFGVDSTRSHPIHSSCFRPSWTGSPDQGVDVAFRRPLDPPSTLLVRTPMNQRRGRSGTRPCSPSPGRRIALPGTRDQCAPSREASSRSALRRPSSASFSTGQSSIAAASRCEHQAKASCSSGSSVGSLCPVTSAPNATT